MLEILLTTICFGCWPPAPPTPRCEGVVSRVLPKTGEILSRTSGTVTFKIANCRANYLFFGPGGKITVFNGASRQVVARFNPASVRKGSYSDMRLYLKSKPSNAGVFRLARAEINASDPGITTGYYTTRGAFALLSFNQWLYERYERLALSWYKGTKRKVWVGDSLATLSGNLGGALPSAITLWNVDHSFIRYGYQQHLRKRMAKPGGNSVQPAGQAFEFRRTVSSYAYNYGESVDGLATSSRIWIGEPRRAYTNVPLIGVANVNQSRVRISN